MKSTAILLILVIASGCATRPPRKMSEDEILERYGDVPMIPDGMAWMIDDMNREREIEDDSNYAQAFLTDLTQGQVALMTVKQIDKGDVDTARRMLLTSVKLNVGLLPVYQKRAKIEEETLADAKAFAQDVLDYLIEHQEELDPRFPDLRGALVGLAQLLADDPVQTKRLEELLNVLAQKKESIEGAESGSRGSPAPHTTEQGQHLNR